MYIPKLVSKETVDGVIRTFMPRGLFYYQESSGIWVGVDNITGDAWVETFESEEECASWLKGI